MGLGEKETLGLWESVTLGKGDFGTLGKGDFGTLEECDYVKRRWGDFGTFLGIIKNIVKKLCFEDFCLRDRAFFCNRLEKIGHEPNQFCGLFRHVCICGKWCIGRC